MGRFELVVRFLAVALLALIYGFVAQRFQLFPYQILNEAVNQATTQFREKSIFAQHYLQPAAYDRQGTHIINEEAVQPGLTLITSLWDDMDWTAGIKLIDKDGHTVHQWKTDILELWPDAPEHLSYIEAYIHGSYLFPNGDVLFNMEHTGLFMIDACGELKWHLDHTTHHSIARDEDGNFWIPGSIKLAKGDKEQAAHLRQFPGLSPTVKDPVWEDRLLKVSPEGEVLTDISLLEVIYNNDLQRYIPKISRRRKGDVLHLNDIDILSQSLAAQYPLFEAGDLVLSLRHLHMVLVMNPQTGVVKWYSADPWIEQHDPDFTGDGWITVFDNNKGFSKAVGPRRGEMLGGSRLVAVQPHTGDIKIVYPTDDTHLFYTKLGGKLQQLDNGNLLITEAKAGRVFEINTDGDLVWEWINAPTGEQMVAEVMEGTRYDISPQQIASWPCHTPK